MTGIGGRLPRLPAPLALTLIAAPALAAGTGRDSPSEAIFVAQVLVLMIVGRLLGEAMLRLGQPAVMGQLIAGLLLGPSLLGWLMPGLHHALFPDAPAQKAMLDAVSQFGILLLLLLTGMETDLKLVRQSGGAAAMGSLMGIVVPFACGVALGAWLPDAMLPDPHKRLITALFLGTALSIASVKIVAIVVREMNFARRVVGQVILASAIIDDSIGWIIISIIFSLALHGTVDGWALGRSLVGAVLFLGVSLTIGRRLVFFVVRWVNDHFTSEFAVITAILVIMGAMALLTDAIGVHAVLGAFVAGVLVGESPILTRHIGEQLRGLITAFFAPVFFGAAGLSADLTILANPVIALTTAGLVAIASLGKFGGAFIGAELGGLTRREGLALACAMNARGSTEVIIATIGLSLGALNQDLFTMIVVMAVITTMAMPPTLRWALARVPLRAQEKQRLEREEMEAKGFVPNLERLLIAVDAGANGKFASRLAGMLAGTRSMPTTVLEIPDGGKAVTRSPSKADGKRAQEAGETVKEAAAEIQNRQKDDEKVDRPVNVTTKVGEAPKPDVIAEEAKKGYGLLVIGLQNPVEHDPEFADGVTALAAGFEGPLAIVELRGDLARMPDGPLEIIVPVNGTAAARRGAEIALTMARATRATVSVLYVAVRNTHKRRPGGALPTGRNEEAILKDIATIADSYDLSISTAVLTDTAADDAILDEVRRRRCNLIVLGVGRRPGEKLFFGDTAASLLKNAECSLLFVAS